MVRSLGAVILLICGRARSQRARGGVELRQPKRDSVINEDRHKFIHDGKEYSRAPNLFDVGGELKLLPEVFSDLNFEAREFVDDGTTEEQRELRDSRPWGRLYVNGWPVPIQYMRSHFGGPAAEGMQSMVLADPLDACEPLRNEGSSIESALVVAARGSCTFTEKARSVQAASASSLLIVNNEEGNVHPPGPDGKDLDIFSAMIPRAQGETLIDVMRTELTEGALVPINCHENSGLGDNQLCHPAVKADRELVENFPLGGFVGLPNGQKFEYLLAEFGAKVPSRGLILSAAHPPDGCALADGPGLTKGKALLASRGGCSFIDKAEAAAAAGAVEDSSDSKGDGVTALIIANDETSLFHMGASPRWRGANVSFPVLLVSDIAGRALSALPQDSPINFTPSQHASKEPWEKIDRLRDPSEWPHGAPERQLMFETLVASNEGFPDRLSALRDAFARVSGEEAVAVAAGEEGKGERFSRKEGAATKLDL